MHFFLVTISFAIISLKFYVALKFSNSTVAEHEQGRVLIFPQTSPTRHQLIAGIGIPLGTQEAITTGWVIKAQYFLPYNVDQLKPVLWPGWNGVASSSSARTQRDLGGHYERYEAEAVKIDTEKLPEGEIPFEEEDDKEFEDGDDSYWLDGEEEDQLQDQQQVPMSSEESEGYNADQSRWITYRTLETVGERYGAGGRACVLRSICEAAGSEFSSTGGVFAELLHVIFTPSSTTEPLSVHNDNEYYRAEQLGREGAPCGRIFHECKRSILDLFTKVHEIIDKLK